MKSKIMKRLMDMLMGCAVITVLFGTLFILDYKIVAFLVGVGTMASLTYIYLACEDILDMVNNMEEAIEESKEVTEEETNYMF